MSSLCCVGNRIRCTPRRYSNYMKICKLFTRRPEFLWFELSSHSNIIVFYLARPPCATVIKTWSLVFLSCLVVTPVQLPTYWCESGFILIQWDSMAHSLFSDRLHIRCIKALSFTEWLWKQLVIISSINGLYLATGSLMTPIKQLFWRIGHVLTVIFQFKLLEHQI